MTSLPRYLCACDVCRSSLQRTQQALQASECTVADLRAERSQLLEKLQELESRGRRQAELIEQLSGEVSTSLSATVARSRRHSAERSGMEAHAAASAAGDATAVARLAAVSSERDSAVQDLHVARQCLRTTTASLDQLRAEYEALMNRYERLQQRMEQLLAMTQA